MRWGRPPEDVGNRRVRVAQTQRKRGKTETESSPQAIYRADVVLLMLLIIEVVVGVRLHPSTPPSTVSCSPPPSVPQATSQLFIYPLRPHIYSAITPEDVIRSLSTPQLSEVASKGKESDGGGGGGRASGDVTLHVLPRDSPEDDRQALAERLFVSR